MTIGGWSLDQLMELAGLSVSQAGKNYEHVSMHQYKKENFREADEFNHMISLSHAPTECWKEYPCGLWSRKQW
jgi:hypothetical protein